MVDRINVRARSFPLLIDDSAVDADDIGRGCARDLHRANRSLVEWRLRFHWASFSESRFPPRGARDLGSPGASAKPATLDWPMDSSELCEEASCRVALDVLQKKIES